MHWEMHGHKYLDKTVFINVRMYIYESYYITESTAASVYGKYSMRGISRDKQKPNALFILRHVPEGCIFIHMSTGGASSGIYIVFWVAIQSI